MRVYNFISQKLALALEYLCKIAGNSIIFLISKAVKSGYVIQIIRTQFYDYAT